MNNSQIPADVYPLFSKPLYISQFNYDLEDVKSKINNYSWTKATSNQGNAVIEDNFSKVTEDFFVLNNTEFTDLKKEIEKHLRNYVNEILKWDQKFKLTTSWFTKSSKNQSTVFHNHNNCMYSGVLYVVVPKEKASITFANMENIRFLLSSTQENIYNSNSFTLDLSANTIIFFPSEVYHKINMNKGDTERISLAFNFIPTGELGKKNSDSYCEVI